MMLKNLKKIGKCVGTLGLALAVTCGGVLAEGNTVKAAEDTYLSVSDISEALIRDGITMQSYVEGSHASGNWRYGKTYDSTGKRVLTLAQQYCFNRITGQGVEPVDNDNTGDVIFNGRGDVKYNNTEYTIDFTNIPEGYHVYRYTPADGTQIPLAGWKNWGENLAIHQESFNVNKYPVGSDFGLIDPTHYGRWAMYHGVEFHSATSTAPMVAPGEIRSTCYDYINHRQYRNSTTWWAVCAICGEYVASNGSSKNTGGNTYAPRDAVKTLPVLEQGVEYCITCPTCGGMEVTGYFSHKCKAISANRYTVNYNIGTSDPNAYGITNNSVWYYNFANLYENVEVKEQDKTIAECGYVRPGYTFMGWSLSENGDVLFQPGASLLFAQRRLSSLDDGASITLYAIWKSNTSYFKIDANANAYDDGALYNGAQVWTSAETPYQTSNGNSFITSTYTIDKNKITLPKGYTVSFDTDGGSDVQNITAEVTFDGYEIIKQDNGFFDTSTGTYTFGKEIGTADTADIIKLQYHQEAINLPGATKSNSSFIGWYTDTSFTNYVGTEGDSYTPAGNVTLYARYSTLDINVTDVYYKANDGATTYDNVARDESGKANNSYSTPDNDGIAVRNATGAANMSMEMFVPNSYVTVYKPYYRLTDNTSTTIYFTSADGTGPVANDAYDVTFEIGSFTPKNASTSNYVKSVENEKGTYTYTVQNTGFYKLDTYGAQGGDSSGYVGGKGGRTYGIFYLKKGDVLTITVGGQDGYGDKDGKGGSSEGYSNGGGRTIISSNRQGTLLIAGGGGGASPSGNGGAGGANTNLRTDNASSGHPGMAGGGAGYVGGNAGEYVKHICTTNDCYTRMTGSTVANTAFYSTISYSYGAGSWNNGNSYSDNEATIGGHTSEAGTNSALVVGNNTSYFNTPYEGTLSFEVNNGSGSGTWGEGADSTITVYVYNKDTGAILYTANSKYATHTTVDTYEDQCCDEHQQHIQTWYYNQSSGAGSVAGYRRREYAYSWQQEYDDEWHGLIDRDKTVLNISVPIPTSVNGVYIAAYVTNDGSSCWWGLHVKDVSYTYDALTKICPYTNGQVISSKPAYGGSNYISSAAQLGTTMSLSGQKDKDGQVSITGVNLNMVDGTDNYVEFLGIPTRDNAAPGGVGELVSDDRNGYQKISWQEPDSNGTSYDFGVEMYKVPNNGSTIQKVQPLDGDNNAIDNEVIVKRTMESAIAGYYYVYDNNASTSVAGYINSRYEKPSYTWSNQHYSDEQTGFTQDTSLTINTNYSYVHVAAVDVAGNIGVTSMKEVARTNLCRITFNTNALSTQLSPNNTVDNGTWNAAGKTSGLDARGQNKQGTYYRGYYAVDGTSIVNNGKGTFDGINMNISFGGEFPTPSAEGCIFIGWNSKPDGTGIYYSSNGNNIGYANISDRELVLSDITGDHLYGQEITLYAIWGDIAIGTTVDNAKNTQNNAIQKTYDKPVLITETGTTVVNGVSIMETQTITTASTADANWSNKTSVKSQAQFSASGVYTMNHHLYTYAGNRIASVDYYMAGMEPNGTAEYTLDTIITNNTSTDTPVWIRDEDEKVTKISTNGSMAIKPDSMYDSSKKSLNIDYNIQGSYKVYGTAVSRTYAANNLTMPGQQGYPGYMITNQLLLKVDKTIPILHHYSVTQPKSLDEFTIEELQNAFKSEVCTTFKAKVSDYNDVKNGVFASSSDSAGIYGVYVAISDLYNPDNAKVFKLALKNQTATTDYDNHVLAGEYEININLFAEFPDSSSLLYRIYTVDNAGNTSEALDSFTTTLPNGTTSEGYPEGNIDTDVNASTEGVGILKNFSVKTVIYNNENEAYNVAEGETYFQVGDIGRVEVWTIGYTNSIQLDFGEMGEEAKQEIESGRLQKIFNMGLPAEGWTRTISWEKSEMVKPESLVVYDDATGNLVTITETSNPTLYNKLIKNDEGIPYIQHYSLEGWGDDGLSVRIPPYYQLTPDGNKTNKDGTPQYKWELWRYAVIANKKEDDVTSTSEYILWDTRANDVHYRVTHES